LIAWDNRRRPGVAVLWGEPRPKSMEAVRFDADQLRHGPVFPPARPGTNAPTTHQSTASRRQTRRHP